MESIDHFGPLALFLTGLVEFLGVPFPGSVVLLAGGALAAMGSFSLPLALVASALGAIVADQIWYHVARARGERLLATACRISLNPQACVCQVKGTFERFGPAALLFAKLIPGLGNLATPVAGATGMRPRVFALYSVMGAFIWAATWIGLGALLEITFMAGVEQIIGWAPFAVAALTAIGLAVLGFKLLVAWWAVRSHPHPRGVPPQDPFAAVSAASDDHESSGHPATGCDSQPAPVVTP